LRIAVPLPLLLALAFGAGPLEGQEVHGRALAPGSAAPVSGVIVTLVDSAGAVVARTLTGGTGSFRVRASHPGLYHLRALRIGFRPTETPAFLLGAGQAVERAIELTGRTISLAAVQVAADRSCRVRPDSSSSAFEAWEEARKALATSVLTRDLRYTMEMVRFDRRVGARGGAVLAENEVEDRGAISRPFVSVPLAELDTVGYVHQDGESTTFRAPDEEVLLSDQFAATHCLRLAEPSAEDEVAVSFEPVAERRLPDIRGTLALDRATGALRRLEFTFANIAPEAQRERAGGEIFFRPLPQGGWIVSRWLLRFPQLERVVRLQPGSTAQERARSSIGSGGNTSRAESFRLHAMQESGGEVTEIARGDSILWQVARPALAGLVRDDSGTVIAGAEVTIPMLDRRATTGADGRFTMRGIRRGRRTMLVATPLLDSLGLPPIARDADSRQTDDIVLTLPSRDALFASACGMPEVHTRDVGFMRGITRGERGERVGGVKIVATWFEPKATPAGAVPMLDPRNPGVHRTLETVSSATGDYSLCGLLLEQVVKLRTAIEGTQPGEASGQIRKASRILLLDLPVRR
jgi:hypothetical protein